MKSRHVEQLSIKEKVDHILDETRVVLPGTQVLLGFQLTAFFSFNFQDIAPLLKNLHLLSLIFIAVAVILLMTPVTYHLIVESGDDSDRFHSFVSKILIVTLAFLGIGLSIDIYVVTMITMQSHPIALCAALGILILSYGLWFGYTLLKKS